MWPRTPGDAHQGRRQRHRGATSTAGAAIAVKAGALAITPDGKTIYLANPEGNTVIPFVTATQRMDKPIKLAGSNPEVEVVYYVAVAP